MIFLKKMVIFTDFCSNQFLFSTWWHSLSFNLSDLMDTWNLLQEESENKLKSGLLDVTGGSPQKHLLLSGWWSLFPGARGRAVVFPLSGGPTDWQPVSSSQEDLDRPGVAEWNHQGLRRGSDSARDHTCCQFVFHF